MPVSKYFHISLLVWIIEIQRGNLVVFIPASLLNKLVTP